MNTHPGKAFPGVAIATGTLKYSDAGIGLNFQATQFTAASVTGNTRTISGIGTVNGIIGYTFSVTLKDKLHDTFR